jgi:hypothetical protein
MTGAKVTPDIVLTLQILRTNLCAPPLQFEFLVTTCFEKLGHLDSDFEIIRHQTAMVDLLISDPRLKAQVQDVRTRIEAGQKIIDVEDVRLHVVSSLPRNWKAKYADMVEAHYNNKSQSKDLTLMYRRGSFDMTLVKKALSGKLPPACYVCPNIEKALSRKRQRTDSPDKIDVSVPQASVPQKRRIYELVSAGLSVDPTWTLPPFNKNLHALEQKLQEHVRRLQNRVQDTSFMRLVHADLLVGVLNFCIDLQESLGVPRVVELAKISKVWSQAVRTWSTSFIQRQVTLEKQIWAFFDSPRTSTISKTHILTKYPALRKDLDKFESLDYNHSQYHTLCSAFPTVRFIKRFCRIFDEDHISGMLKAAADKMDRQQRLRARQRQRETQRSQNVTMAGEWLQKREEAQIRILQQDSREGRYASLLEYCTQHGVRPHPQSRLVCNFEDGSANMSLSQACAYLAMTQFIFERCSGAVFNDWHDKLKEEMLLTVWRNFSTSDKAVDWMQAWPKVRDLHKSKLDKAQDRVNRACHRSPFRFNTRYDGWNSDDQYDSDL